MARKPESYTPKQRKQAAELMRANNLKVSAKNCDPLKRLKLSGKTRKVPVTLAGTKKEEP